MSFKTFKANSRRFVVPDVDMDPIHLRGLRPEEITDIALYFAPDLEQLLALVLDEESNFDVQSIQRHAPYIVELGNRRLFELVSVIAVAGAGFELGTEQFDEELEAVMKLPLAARMEICREIVLITTEDEGGLGKFFDLLRKAIGGPLVDLVLRKVESVAGNLRSLDLRDFGVGLPESGKT